MYVRWKVLIGLGLIFWALLCLTDYLSIKRIEPIVIETENLKTEEIVMEPTLPEVFPPEVENLSYIKIAFWNLVAFVSTLSVCFTLKSLKTRISTNYQVYHFEELSLKKISSSKIPIPISGKTSSTDIHIEGLMINPDFKDDVNKSCPNLLALSDISEADRYMFDGKNEKQIWSIRNMEKHCAKLREEMINLQATSLKEQSSISKKLDTLTREKRELTKQLNSVLKENKTMKQQLEEMIEERTLLIKRLECATKEIRANTKSKKITMAKLEEALLNAESLKTNLEQISRDKLILEDKLTMLDAEYKRLKEQLALYNNTAEELKADDVSETDKLDDNKEHVIDKYDLSDDMKCADEDNIKCDGDFDISQSEQDMKKVQLKLIRLEKSLENFKFQQNTTEATADKETSAITKTESQGVCTCQDENVIGVCDEPSINSICTEPSCPLEHTHCTNPECLFNKTDLPNETAETLEFSSGDDSSCVSLTLQKQGESSKKRFKYLRTTISDDRLSVITERATSTGGESCDEWGPKKRFLTNSPEFQFFLKKHGSHGSKNSHKHKVEHVY